MAIGCNGKAAIGESSKEYLLPKEETPILENSKSCLPKTFANFFIAIVGAGVLGLPYTFMKTGWITGLVTLFSVAALTYHGMMLLIHTRKRLDLSLIGDSKISSFGDLGFVVCGPIGRFAVDVMIVLAQVGFCIGYLIFIGNTLSHLLSLSKGFGIGIPLFSSTKSLYIWGCFPFQLGLTSIPSLTLLAPLSIFADVAQIGAMGVVMVEDVMTFTNQWPSDIHAFGTVSTFFYGLGVALYSFEGVGMAIPLEAEMKDKSKYGKILALSMFLIALIYGTFGVMGYFAFGSSTKDIVTSNMGKGVLSTLVKVGLCINLFFTFPLMLNPAFEVFERRFCDGNYCVWMRWILVLGVTLVALLVPNFADFMSLVGSSTCCTLGFILPALFHYQVFKEDMDRKGAFFDLGLIALGVFFGVSGTWYSLVEMFADAKNV
ncbi:amino acid transporter AVT3B-like [Nicotiana tabacum]|uniref:Amino acid transporter ANTL1-like n=2 Tax=Nicotiana TaxID=4085 RepID=A0A1S4DLL2_TOBAC|nr:PREDICTED: proton-coupled amino acid transporter 3-like [Nicotiana sylvestris]XP_016514296.1 PREDICTED: amino acid transporter ANTL1-like [Nicotiana tabacum]